MNKRSDEAEYRRVRCDACGAMTGKKCFSVSSGCDVPNAHAARKKEYYRTFFPKLFREMYGDA